ncbi:hypothetical protein C4D60_Mb04t19570 [Musa balbisiana]|uniref:Uncharacterized protein n=1 Tax=Musa balbisiana TaxID=52838 RepID=A0A4S8KD60_MUSBA|nr:hypothetical protein C4D60_Mb04t19570 [Musa balbisiana]
MVRAPCCEKMGLKRGSWTPEEDQILVAYIRQHGHGNWRALPKQAGLLRCGKSCRLRWVNYLRPDIKRGNFTKEEEETIISLHEAYGNRWSAIATKLPGRTDNEIKNVWHTHLKKLVSPSMPSTPVKKKKKNKKSSEPITAMPPDTGSENTGCRFMSVSQSPCDFSSCATDSSTEWGEISDGGKEGSFCSEKFSEIDESFWLEEWSMDDRAASVSFTGLAIPPSPSIGEQLDLLGASDSCDEDFWLRVFMGAGDLQELSPI